MSAPTGRSSAPGPRPAPLRRRRRRLLFGRRCGRLLGHGHSGRLDHVGGCCRHGNGVPQDYAQAVSLIHIKAAVLDRLRAMPRPGESYSDVILRIAGREGAQ